MIEENQWRIQEGELRRLKTPKILGKLKIFT